MYLLMSTSLSCFKKHTGLKLDDILARVEFLVVPLGERGASIYSGDKQILPPEAFGIKVISMGMLVPPDQPIIWRGPSW